MSVKLQDTLVFLWEHTPKGKTKADLDFKKQKQKQTKTNKQKKPPHE